MMNQVWRFPHTPFEKQSSLKSRLVFKEGQPS
jgi:hypothetical protein